MIYSALDGVLGCILNPRTDLKVTITIRKTEHIFLRGYSSFHFVRGSTNTLPEVHFTCGSCIPGTLVRVGFRQGRFWRTFLFCPISSYEPMRSQNLSNKYKQTIRLPHHKKTNLLHQNRCYHTFGNIPTDDSQVFFPFSQIKTMETFHRCDFTWCDFSHTD